MKTIAIIGCGAVGYPLAAFLSAQGRDVIAVRTGHSHTVDGLQDITVRLGDGVLCAKVRSVRLSGCQASKLLAS